MVSSCTLLVEGVGLPSPLAGAAFFLASGLEFLSPSLKRAVSWGEGARNVSRSSIALVLGLRPIELVLGLRSIELVLGLMPKDVELGFFVSLLGLSIPYCMCGLPSPPPPLA